LQVSDSAFAQVTGIDESFFGASAGGNETAILQRQRIQQATTTLAPYFDSITLYGIEQARMMLSFMRLLVEASDGRLFKAQGEEGEVIFEKMSPNFFTDEYEVDIGESADTPALKEFYASTLTQVAAAMMQVGDQRYREMYATAVEHMPFTVREKMTIKKILLGEAPIDPSMVEQLQAQVEQLQGAQAQAALAKQGADIEWIQAQAEQTKIRSDKAIIEMEKLNSDIRETEEDIETKAIENDLMAFKKPEDVNVTI